MNIAEFGQSIKKKYPQYNDIPDEEIGSKMLQKYPQYQDIVTTAPVVQPQVQPEKPNNALSSVVDFIAPQTAKFTKDILNVPKAYNQAKQEASAAKEKNPNAIFFNPSPELRSLEGGSSKETGNPMLNNILDTVSKFRTSSGAGTEIGSLLASFKGLFNGAKNALHPIQNTGKKLEAVRSLVDVPAEDATSSILKGVQDNKVYKFGDKSFQKGVDNALTRLVKGTSPEGTTTVNLNEIYKNLEAMRPSTNKESFDILSKAVRDYANPLQTDAGVKLAKTYSTLKNLQKYEKTVKLAAVGSATAGTVWALRTKLSKLLGL